MRNEVITRNPRIGYRVLLFLVGLLIWDATPAIAHGDEEQWDVVRLDLDVELCPRHSNLFGQGTAKLRLVRGSSHGPTLVVRDVSRFTKCTADNGAAGEVRMTPQRAEVRFPRSLHAGEEVEVSFEFRSGGDSCPVVVTPQCAYARCHGDWYPHPLGGSVVAPGTTRLNVPEDWRTLANGTLADSHVEESRRIDTWKSEAPTARSFVAGPYSVRRFSGKGGTVVTYFLGEDSGKATTYGEGLQQVLSVLETRFGPYPYEACTLVEIPNDVAAWKGAAENGLIFVGSSELRSEGFNTALIAHEVAHQWWGNYVGSRNPAALMVDEALAQYGIVLVIEALEGEQAATEFLRFSREGYLPCECARAYFNRIRGQEHDKPLMELTGEGRDYWLAKAKGHWVYHMLRQRVGDELFFQTLRELIARHGGGEMSLADLRAAFVTAAPPEAALATFFRQWFDRPSAPVLDVTWTAEAGTSGPAARVTIQQKGEPYELRLEVAVDSGGASRMHVVSLSAQEQTFVLPAPGGATGVRIDPNHRLLIWNADYEGAPGR
ncbi:MAG: M1 family aminopeptidase [Planctomycetota bacterium]